MNRVLVKSSVAVLALAAGTILVARLSRTTLAVDQNPPAATTQPAAADLPLPAPAVQPAATPAPATQAAGNLPAGWSDSDIGAVALAGLASYDAAGQTWTVAGSGSDIFDTADQFNFASQTVSGDQTIIAKVTGITSTDGWTKSGVMFRDGPAAGAINIAIVASRDNGIVVQWRTAIDGGTTSSFGHGGDGVATPTSTNPVWLKLVKSGASFTGFYSTDGTNWTQLGDAVTIDFANANYLAGLASTSHDNTQTNTATFTNVTIAGSGK